MITFIIILRAIAACLITNAHYVGIYPADIIANGGLIGDVLFFMISGYCLFSTKKGFFRWYGKRFTRVYLPVLIITITYFILGAYSFNVEQNFVYWFLWPTGYHFVGSILLLYIPFYFVARYEIVRKNIPWIMSGGGVLYLIVYIFIYDKSFYHIDTVREPMIWFLFFESMLMGAYFRQNDEKYRNEFRWWQVVTVVGFAAIYFISKLVFAKGKFVEFQIINQGLIFALGYFLFRLFCGLDNKLEKLPKPIMGIFEFLSKITLEIYVVQNVLIDALRPHFSFPINWFVITASILLSAWILHWCVIGIEKGVLWCIEKLKAKKETSK